jgi:hypothetical protein
MASTLSRLSDASATCLRCPGRLFVRHCSLGQQRSRTFSQACSGHKRAPGGAGFEVAQRASLQRAYFCNIRRRAFRGMSDPR